MQIRQLMTQPVLTASTTDLIGQIIHAMNERRVTSVPVVDEQGCVVGMICQRDLFERPALDSAGRPAAIQSGEALSRQPVVDVMRRDVLCATEEDAVSEAAWWMVDYGLDLLPVVRGGRLVGVVTRADLVRLFAQIM